MQDDELKVSLAIIRIKKDYEAGRLRPAFHKKTTDYLRSKGLTYQLVAREAVAHITDSSYHRGPSPHHWKKSTEVYEFLEFIDAINMYAKFSVNMNSPEAGTELESFHEAEKKADNTWQQAKH